MLRVRLAGSLALESDGREIALPASRRARALLAYLAAHPGAHARGELAARFWPDVLDESARASLRAALSELRRALGPEAGRLVATRETVALDGAWVDVREAGALLGAGRIDDAVAVCDGELLRGMDDDWVFELRRSHAERVRGAGAARAAEAIAAPAALERDELFVGRIDELARLGAAWRFVCERRARGLVLLAGEPGVGKTRLALRFAREAGDATVLLGRCSEDPLAAFEPFSDVLRHVGPAAARTLAGSSELDRLLGGARHAPDDDAGARHRLFAAVDDVVTGIAERRPLVLVLDDLHWADRPTLLLLSFLLRSGRPAPVLVIGTYRDTDVGRRTPLAAALADLRRDGGAERIGLRGLAPRDVGELATAWLGAEASARVASDVHARTGGNAFFVEEVLRGLAGDDASVPESVRHAVGARLARLSPEADDLLAVAAVLGLVVDAELLAGVWGRPPDEVEPLLDELFDARLLLAGDGRRLEFPHALVREAVDRDLNPLRRARLHRSAAAALIARGEERHLAEIAHHLSEAADERAPSYLRRAGEEALAMLAYEEAAAQFERALDATAEAGSGPLLVARGDALLRAGEPAQARACFELAASLARRAGDPVLLGRAALGHAGLGVAIIDLDAPAIALLEEALAALGDREPVLRSELLARLAVELYYAVPRDRSETLSSQAVTVAREAGDRRAVAAALNARHVALWRPDRLSERLATADEMLAVADEPHLELQARNWRVVDLFEAFEIDEWRAEVERHGELAARVRMPTYAWYTPLWAAVDAVHAGRWAQAAALRERAREEGRRAGDRNADLFADMLSFDEVIMLGAWDRLDLALLLEKIETSPAGMAWRAAHVWMLAATGRHDAAREQYAIVAGDDFAALPFDVNWQSGVGELASAAIELADPELARPVYERLLPYAGRALTAGRAITSFGSTERLLGGLAALLGRPSEAASRLEDAAHRNEAAGFTVWADHSRDALAALRSRTFPGAGR